MSKEPVARIKTRPKKTPCFVPEGTTARTISPVWKPLTCFAPLGFEQGKPIALTLHRCLHPCPLAVISKGEMCWTYIRSGVLLPTQDASTQWAFVSPLLTRLNLVNPPLPTSTGNPNACKRRYNAHLVAFTALASLRGVLA